MGKHQSKVFRKLSDPSMVADMGFKRQLTALDPELDVVWDYASGRWEIWRFPGQAKAKKKRMNHRAFHMMTVQTENRTFRELGADILLRLRERDPTRYSLKELCAYFDAMDDNIERSKRKNIDNMISDITWDSYDYMRGVTKVQVPRRFQGGKVISIPQKLKVQRAIAGV